MRSSIVSLLLLGAANIVKGDVHQLIVGTFGTKSLYTLEFDDVALTLDLVQNYTAAVSSSWIALSHDKKSLYGNVYRTTANAYVSYSLGSATDISNAITVQGSENCTSTGIYVLAASQPPYAVYGVPFAGSGSGCGTVISVDEAGDFTGALQNYTYLSTSGVHGVAMNKESTFLYSADDAANSLWTHSVDPSTGAVTQVDVKTGPSEKSDPRHVTVHPGGKFLYVLLEGSNEVAQYNIDQATGIPSFENVTYPLIPANSSDSSFWSDEVALSTSGNYLWATSRARPTTDKGYISVFSLGSDGAIIDQLFLSPTTSSGGSANAVTPSEFSDKYVALTDSATGWVEIWALADDGSTASAVAHLDIVDGGCCANAVWYS